MKQTFKQVIKQLIIEAKDLLNQIKNEDDEFILMWMGFESKQEYKKNTGLEYSKENAIKTHYKDIEDGLKNNFRLKNV